VLCRWGCPPADSVEQFATPSYVRAGRLGQLPLPPAWPRRSVEAHAQHEHGRGQGAQVIVPAGRCGYRWQYVCQTDVPAPQGPHTLESFQEALASLQGLQPTRGAQAIPVGT
jgi:hypothetical protein